MLFDIRYAITSKLTFYLILRNSINQQLLLMRCVNPKVSPKQFFMEIQLNESIALLYIISHKDYS